MGNSNTTPSFADFIFDIPSGADIGVSEEETEKYKEMVYCYYEHHRTPDEDIYADPIIQYLKNMTDPPEPVSTFMSMLEEAGVLTDTICGTSVGAHEPSLELAGRPHQPSSDQELNDLDETFVELGPKPELLDEGLYFEYLRHDGFRLLSAPCYTIFPTDFTIRAGSGKQLCIFRVSSGRMTQASPFFNNLLQSGKCGSPGQYCYTSDEHPVAMDWYLAYLYGLPFDLCLVDNKTGPPVLFLHSLVRLAINTQCDTLIEDITEELGRSFTYYKNWGPDIASCLVDLYNYHYIHLWKEGNQEFKITIPQLVEWISALQIDKKLVHLAQFIGSNQHLESAPGSGKLLKDISIALCKVLHIITLENGGCTPGSSFSECDSTVLVDVLNGLDKPAIKEV
ncbi:hypothetical protein TWF481_007533 [Arthrobotrys musiformis]|uniref:BTB domain-containing protein n=1 Tax=Arthrobotrys musiformis TaxID=47236 RepID=A0AAV9WBX9_9PEZI